MRKLIAVTILLLASAVAMADGKCVTIVTQDIEGNCLVTRTTTCCFGGECVVVTTQQCW